MKVAEKKIYVEYFGQGKHTEDLLALLRKRNPTLHLPHVSEAEFALLFIIQRISVTEKAHSV